MEGRGEIRESFGRSECWSSSRLSVKMAHLHASLRARATEHPSRALPPAVAQEARSHQAAEVVALGWARSGPRNHVLHRC